MKRFRLTALAAVLTLAMTTLSASAATEGQASQSAIDFWTPELIAEAIPRDLVLDRGGAAYLAMPDGTYVPYGGKAPVVGPPDGRGPGNGGGGGDDSVKNAEWTAGGVVQTASGRILFQMGSSLFVCSGTSVTDGVTGRSVILTAAHCVYDDVAKAFAINVLFIPNQAGTTGSGTDTNCANDPYGCLEPTIGVVDVNWTTRTFPDNIPWDYAFYVDTGTDGATGTTTLPIDFSAPTLGDYTHALGYSYSDDPNFMYCAQDVGTIGEDNYWLSSCGLSGGSSGGPWVQPMDLATGSGPVISVNSWGYRGGRPGMAGPLLAGTSAEALFDAAKVATGSTIVP